MNVKEAVTILAGQCSRREYCKWDLQQKLKKWKCSDTTIQEVLSILEKQNFINEERFAEAFVKDKSRFNRWGIVKIRFALKQKKIAEVVIEDALQQIDDNEQVVILKALIDSKRRTLKASSDYELQQKIFRSLMAKGFEYDAIKKAMH